MVFRNHILFVFLLTFLALCTSIQAAPSLDCVAVQVAPLPPEQSPDGSMVAVTLTNHCGKDITAYRVMFRDSSSGRPVRYIGHELLVALLPGGLQGVDILRKNGSRTITATMLQPMVVSVSAAIFIDDSTMGAPNDVVDLMSMRRAQLEWLQEKLQILDSLSTWAAASDLYARADEAKKAGSRFGWYFDYLVERFDQSNPASWEALVAKERKSVVQLIDIFKLHLGAAAN